MAWIPPIFIMCNPIKEKDRFERLQDHLCKRGIPSEKIHFVCGPWGSELNSSLYFQVYDPFRQRYGVENQLSFKASALTKGEVSLGINLYLIIQEMSKLKDEYILIFESDIYLREDFIERLRDVLEENKKKYDYISLGEGVGTRPEGVGISYFTKTKLYPPTSQWVFRCCDSMLLKRTFLEKLQTTFLPFREISDWEFNFQILLHKGTTAWADPPLAEPGTNRGRVITNLPA